MNIRVHSIHSWLLVFEFLEWAAAVKVLEKALKRFPTNSTLRQQYKAYKSMLR